ncbi:MAG: transcription termination/antitermination protein NusG [Planctomycetaceae bacterium]|nr:transcription termination/antitermination protein NusG [Planctomycetaceae bacterium]
MQKEPTPVVDPAAGENELRWYVLKVQSNRERTIRDNLVRRMKQEGLEEFFGEIVIPTEKLVETKGGKKRVTEHKLFPGYLMVQMVLNDDTWYLVRSTSGVGDFTGSAGKPMPMQPHEIQRMLGQEESKKEEAPLKVKVDFQTGDHVKIKDGAFESFDGTIEAIDEANGKITVLIQIFGRPTPVDLEYWQVERV